MAVIRFDPNTPVELALKYDSGKRVQSTKTFTDKDGKVTTMPDQMMYTLCGDDTIYVPLIVGEMIAEKGIQRAELFSICKRVVNKVTRWEVKRLVAETPAPADDMPPSDFDRMPTDIDASPLSRKLVDSINQVRQQKASTLAKSAPTMPADLSKGEAPPNNAIPSGHTHASLSLAASLIAGIDAVKLAEQYAESKGIPVKPLVVEFLAEDLRAIAATIYIQACKDNSQLAGAVVRNGNGHVNGGAQWQQPQ